MITSVNKNNLFSLNCKILYRLNVTINVPNYISLNLYSLNYKILDRLNFTINVPNYISLNLYSLNYKILDRLNFTINVPNYISLFVLLTLIICKPHFLPIISSQFSVDSKTISSVQISSCIKMFYTVFFLFKLIKL